MSQLAQAQQLFQVQRYQDAEAALREVLAGEPTYPYAHALLALALYHQSRYTDALQEAQTAIGLAPNRGFYHYVEALALLALDRDEESQQSVREALRLDPAEPRYHALLGDIYLRKKAWEKALSAAEAGLRLDPEDVACTNLRGMALVKLGRKDEAHATLADALARDPENASTHANQGWALLHEGNQEEAFIHFREALRLNPLSQWARAGIVEAMKARSPIYRLLLRYFLWMSRLTTEEQWGVSIFTSGTLRALRVFARKVPLLYLIVLPLNLIYFIFVVLTWTARPLFALLLRLDRFGRLALPKEEIIASNWVGVCLLTSFSSALAALLFRHVAFLVPAVAALALILPVAGVFRCPPGKRRGVLVAGTVLLALAGLSASLAAWIGTPLALSFATVFGIAFVSGWILYSWIANLLISIG